MNRNCMKEYLNMDNSDVVAIIPAAGRASRLPGLKHSKEIHPVTAGFADAVSVCNKKPVCFYLLEKLAKAGVSKSIMVIREEKWDIVKTLGSGGSVGIDIMYQMLKLPHGTAYTIDQVYPFVKYNIVALGFPDILFAGENAFASILNTLRTSDADIVLGLFPADKPHKVDMVRIDENMNVLEIDIKPQITALTLTWGIAVWKPAFTHMLRQTLASTVKKSDDPELFIGDVIKIAINRGLKVRSEIVSKQAFIDIGTPDDLARVC